MNRYAIALVDAALFGGAARSEDAAAIPHVTVEPDAIEPKPYVVMSSDRVDLPLYNGADKIGDIAALFAGDEAVSADAAFVGGSPGASERYFAIQPASAAIARDAGPRSGRRAPT